MNKSDFLKVDKRILSNALIQTFTQHVGTEHENLLHNGFFIRSSLEEKYGNRWFGNASSLSVDDWDYAWEVFNEKQGRIF